MEIVNLLHFAKRSELRLWLEANYNRDKECWVVTYRSKQPDWPAIPYIDVVEEALCFGWIDSTLKRLPDGRLAQRLSPRRPKSHWTKLNIDRCMDLEDRGLMTLAGRRAFEKAKIMTRILILCTGNSCRSQMAMSFLQSLSDTLDVHSAGTNPTTQVHPLAVKAMAEVGISLENAKPKSVEKYLAEQWDYVITVCGGANENCPAFVGKVGKRLHIGFDDPASATGTEEEQMAVFMRIRDEIMSRMKTFYEEIAK